MDKQNLFPGSPERIAELEAEGLTTSDAQGVADAEVGFLFDRRSPEPRPYAGEERRQLIRLPADPHSAGVLRGEISPFAGPIVERVIGKGW